MKPFQTESKRLLDLMIHSIYTHKEIFLRELISNASDALDKAYYRCLTEEGRVFEKDDFYIRLEPDKQARTLKVIDTGVGMNAEELETNLGTIAQSGSLAFKKDAEAKDEIDIIGQFGVGFYAAFMVSEEVLVRSRPEGAAEGYEWRSSGAEGYTIAPCDKQTVGTEVILRLKPDTEDEQFGEFLEEYRLKALVQKYSDFIKYPIRMTVHKSRLKEGSEQEREEYTEEETLNTMVPLWRKNKSELSQEDYDAFYTAQHYGYQKPLKAIHTTADGAVSYTALLYIPSQAPYDFYTKEFEKGLTLYANGVMIMQKCGDLLPDYFGFAQGLVDSGDLSLNISRELLQHDRQLRLIAKRIKEKIKNELMAMLQNERDKYETFFKSFGRQLKYGAYAEWGSNKEFLQDLLLFYSSTEKKQVTLSEYVTRMKESQKYIYYAAGESHAKIEKLPQTERLVDEGMEILYFTDDVDEFAVKVLRTYQEKEFKSVSSGDWEPDTDEKAAEENKTLFEALQTALSGKVKEVRASKRLKTHPVCLVSEGELSIEMEKVLRQMPDRPDAPGLQAEKILEINTSHKMFASLVKAHTSEPDAFTRYARLLYDQALLIEGLPIEDPVRFANDVCELM